MLAFSAAIAGVYRISAPGAPTRMSPREQTVLQLALAAMVILAWLTVFSGAYIVYPWYRAVPPAGVTDLAEYPRRLLLSNNKTSEWHNVGMEWKEHIAWLVPISITMAAAVVIRYGRDLRNHPQLRAALLCFTLVSFLAAGIAGFFGAMLVKHAPVEGGQLIHLMHGE